GSYRQRVGGQVGTTAAIEQSGRESWESALEEVKDEDEDAEPTAEDAADIGGADVAAAVGEQVDAAPPSDKVAKGNGADEIGNQRGQADRKGIEHGEVPGWVRRSKRFRQQCGRSRDNLLAPLDVIPDDVAIQLTAGGEEDAPLGRLHHLVGEADVFGRLVP